MTSVHLHQSLTESSLCSYVVDDVPDFELTAYKHEGMLSSLYGVAVHGGVSRFQEKPLSVVRYATLEDLGISWVQNC